MDKQLFKAEVKKQLTLRNWSYADLAEHTKYTPKSIKTILNDDTRLSENAVASIASALEIDINKLS